MSGTSKLDCSFCGKGRKEVERLIVANDVAICDECVDLCSNIIVKEQNDRVTKDKSLSKFLDPMRLKEYLDHHIIGQSRAKMTLSVAVVNHYKRVFLGSSVELDKSNVLLFGPSGSGKTLLAKYVAKYINVPFVVADATTLTEAGYVGDDAESVVARLYASAGFDVEKTERGIVFIDEIDKISRKSESSSATKDVSGEGVQQALLKLVEGTKCSITTGKNETVEIDTSKILFIAGGAFVDLEKIVNARTQSRTIGFSNTSAPLVEVSEATPDDFTKFGMIPEFTGRFPVSVYTEKLEIDDLVKVLTEPENSLVKQMKFYFQADDIELEFTDEAVQAIATKAYNHGTGARGLRAIMEQILMPYFFAMKTLVGDNVYRVRITDAVVNNNDPAELFYKD